MHPMAKQLRQLEVSSKHFAKEDGRWVVLFGMYDGKPIAEIPCPYLRWMLRCCAFVKGKFRTAIWQLLARREERGCYACELGQVGLGPTGRSCLAQTADPESAQWTADMDHVEGCTCRDCDQQDLYDACGLGDFDAPWGDQ